VFGYFTDPARLVQWMGAEATLDPRPGGVFRMVFHPSPEAAAVIADASGRGGELNTNAVLGEFVDVDPYDRIAFTWGYETEMFAMPPQSTSVEVSLTPVGEQTVVRLVHRRLPAAGTAFHRAGWDHYLPRLAIAAAGGDPGPDPASRTTRRPS
jgi:uncharacterized protein YndB with AHSA1/START domain